MLFNSLEFLIFFPIVCLGNNNNNKLDNYYEFTEKHHMNNSTNNQFYIHSAKVFGNSGCIFELGEKIQLLICLFPFFMWGGTIYEILFICIDSIIAQTFTDYELILVDDGSPDNCGKICDEYAQKDSRIHVIHKKNGGRSEARNVGIDWMFRNYNGMV